MEKKNLENVAEILKNCPKGTKLYSPLYGEGTFGGIDKFGDIIFIDKNGVVDFFDKFGRWYADYDDAKYLLFPSKDIRDWKKFQKLLNKGTNTLKTDNHGR